MAKNKNKNKKGSEQLYISPNPYMCGNSENNCGGNCSCDDSTVVETVDLTVAPLTPESVPTESNTSKPEGYENVSESEIPRDFLGDLPTFSDDVVDIIDNEKEVTYYQIERNIFYAGVAVVFALGYGTSCLIKTLRS